MQHEFNGKAPQIQELTYTVEQVRVVNRTLEESAAVFSLFRDIANESVNSDFISADGKNGLYVIAEKMASQCFETYLPTSKATH